MIDEQAGGLARSNLDEPGLIRRRSGRGFRYLSASGQPVTDPATLARIKGLVIPPAWREVWISPDPDGHIQAIGTDAAGRRRYRYHDQWREHRDQLKFDRVLEFGAALPRIRETVVAHLGGSGLRRDRVLAAAIRLIDLGFFRAGGEEYAAENGTYGLATIRREHVVCLKRRRWGGTELLAYRTGAGGHDVTAADINDYLREISGGEFTAKDFRTWNATVLAAVGLAVSERADSDTARERAIARVIQEVAGYLGNTPAVARAAYIDPRVIDSYERGVTISRALGELGASSQFGELATEGGPEAAVLRLLREARRAGS